MTAVLRAAISLADAGRVVILTKADPRESNTGYAQGGIAAVLLAAGAIFHHLYKGGIVLDPRFGQALDRTFESIRGAKRAIVAVGRSILIIIWHLLADPDARFHDLGAGFYHTRINPERAKRNHVRQLEALGYKVTLQPAA